MAKLYPPYIEGTLPAFSLSSGNGIVTIPFELNKAVSIKDLEGKTAFIKVKTVQNDVLLTTVEGALDLKNKIITIPVSNSEEESNKWKVDIGQYYKLQVAFGDSNEIGYYSTVGVVKCTSKPELSILGFELSAINNNKREFVGQFLQGEGGDVTEKVYSSKFEIKDSEENIIATSGDMLHNVENNPNSYSSLDTFVFNRDLEIGQVYTITYTVTTTNGLVESVTYYLEQPRSIESDFKGELYAELNKEEAYIELSLIGEIKNDEEQTADGTFLISREDQMNKGYWEPIYQFTINHKKPSELEHFRDFTIEQGKTYVYVIQQVNEYGIYSSKEGYTTNPIYSDFDDMFLFDGTRQLKIQFNPQVSSFKTQLAEAKTDTIGSKYPFFFRNARVGYKTFPISGLISMFIDDNQEFITYDEILREDFRFDRHSSKSNKKEHPEDVYDQHWEIDHNFVSERLFKLAVLDWFNNGKVKLFKSPGEGNYLVRLMETSLTPQTPLGRMIHTINATAYECADLSYDSLVKYGIIEEAKGAEAVEETYDVIQDVTSIFSLLQEYNKPASESQEDDEIVFYANAEESGEPDISKWVSPFKGDSTSGYYWGLLSNSIYYITDLKLNEFMPGTKFKLILSDNTSYTNPNSITIQIGPTGSYYASNVNPIYQIYLVQDTDQIISLSGTIQYSYTKVIHKRFNLIKETISKIGWYRQLVGQVDDVVDVLRTTKDEPLDITMANFKKRPVEYLYYKEGDLTPEAGSIFKANNLKYNMRENTFYLQNISQGDSGVFDSEGYRVLDTPYRIKKEDKTEEIKLYWDSNFTKPFSDKASLEYSPFSLYVLKSSLIDEINDDIIPHLGSAEPKESSIHIDNHMFEKYYIDRYLTAQTAEEVLTNKTLNPNQGKPVYVLDALFGKIYKVGNDEGEFLYNPSIDCFELQEIEIDGKSTWEKVDNSEMNIDLREIQEFNFKDINPKLNSFTIGNGVYGEIFYNEIETTYSIEEENGSNSYIMSQAYNSFKNKKNSTLTFEDLFKMEVLYNKFNQVLAEDILHWEEE